MPAKNFYRSALITGLIAGALDLSGAIISFMISNDRFPEKILETIAGGFFGKDAMTGGWVMKGWGLFFHFFTAIAFTFFYFFLYPRIKFLQKNIFLSAFIYGLFVWAVMNMIVLPLSAYHSPVIKSDYAKAAKEAFILIVCIGLPVAIGAKAYYKRKL
jgi:uncharacterized membrane protein YagU involved in acid resistance